MKLKVYSASAGSGKTFSLTVEYLKKLLKNPKAYKNVLAVTFTNKATAEMKNRILSLLWNIVYQTEKAQAEIDAIKGEKNASLSEQEKANAALALTSILHDYNHFWIETIDSFFQRVLRNMAREIGVSSGFELVIDDKDYRVQAVEELKEDTQTNKKLDECLRAYIDERKQEGKKWNFEKDMEEFSDELSKTIIDNAMRQMSFETLQDILKETADKEKEIQEFIDNINQYIEQAKRLALEAEKEYKAFVYSRFIEGYSFKEDSEGEGKIIKQSKKSEKQTKHITDKLNELHDQCVEYYKENYPRVKRLRTIYSSARKLCLLVFIYQREHEMLRENNSFLLRHTQRLLNQMVDSKDAVPFMYEKIGSRLQHIMIDEFQDTDSLAWNNFNLLVAESLASGGECSVFGDVKQSIYRWRDGDWQILKALYDRPNDNKYSLPTEQLPLKDNYRTDGKIVEFNNRFFQHCFQTVAGFTIDAQTAKKNLEQGEVRFSFVDKFDTISQNENMLYKTVEEIDRYLALGYSIGDIVILVRKTSYARELAKYLKDLDNSGNKAHKYNPCSFDAFALESSSEVKKIVYLLRYIYDQKDTISRYWLEHFAKIDNIDCLKDYNKSSISLIDLVLCLIKDFNIDAQDTFVMAFCDKLMTYCSLQSNDLRLFLDYWKATMSQESVTVQKDKNTLEIQTIHKAKGLEYKVVIIPYCHWDMTSNKHKFWIENLDEQSKVKIFETKVKSLRQMSDGYVELADQEEYMERIDNINLLYVAFTRAKNALSIIAKLPPQTDFRRGDTPNLVSTFIYNYLQECQERQECERVDESSFRGRENFFFGKEITELPKTESSNKESQSSSDTLNPFNQKAEELYTTVANRLDFDKIDYALSKQAIAYFDTLSQEKDNQAAKWGSLIHTVLSHIKTRADIEQALSYLPKDKADIIRPVVESMFEFVAERHWFDNTYRVLTEVSIADTSCQEKEQIKRPDRIMIKGKEAVVVDYKFVKSFDNIENYHEQLSEYGRRLTEMGFDNVKTYIWAVKTHFEQPNENQTEMKALLGEIEQRVVEVGHQVNKI